MTYAAFAEAVRATVMRWTALNLAVSYQFGDGHSENHRREELIQQTVAGFASAHAANKRCARPPARAAEQPFENIAEVRAARVETAARLAAEAATRTAAAPAKAEGRGRIAIAVNFPPVEPGALVLVGQQVIGVGNGGKLLRRLGIVLVPVRMKLLGQLAIGGLDVRLAGAAGYAQSGIGIGHSLYLLHKSIT